MRSKRILCACLAAALMIFSSTATAAGSEAGLEPADAAVEESTMSPASPAPEEDQETPDMDEPPAGDETSGMEEPSAEGETPDAEELPVGNETSGMEEPPAEGETPDEEEPPAGNEAPGMEEPPAEGETPDADESPAGDKTLDMDEAPASDEASVWGEELEPAMEDESEVIRVTIPDGDLIVNPYKLRVVMDGEESREQVVCKAVPLASYSNVPVQVNATAYGVPVEGSEAVFVKAPPAENASGKELFAYIEFQNTADGITPAGAWSGEYSNAPNQLMVTNDGVGKTGLLYLDAAESEESPAYGLFRVFGAASGSPAEMWTESDGIQITIVFTFSLMA